MRDRAYAKAQTQEKTWMGLSPKSSLLQRTCACGQHTIAGGECSTCRNQRSTLLRSQRAFEPPSAPGAVPGSSPAQKNGTSFNSAFDRTSRFGHDFSKVPVHTNTRAAETTITRDETIITDQSGGAPSPAPLPTHPPQAKPTVPLTVDRIDIIDSKAGAISGYPPIEEGDLNSPGPFNEKAMGIVSNALQIHFHLDKGNSAFLTPRRELQRTIKLGTEESKKPESKKPPDSRGEGPIGPLAPGGFGGVLVGPDGPGAHEVIRPTTDKIVVADAPGVMTLSATDYPIIYKAHFTVTVADAAGTDIARTKYDLMIEKRSAADIPNTENRITSVEKKDLVRKRNLP